MNWSRKRVLVTGRAGFFGSHVVERLQDQDCGYIFVPRSAEYDLSMPGDQPRRRLDTNRAEREFGFKAKTPFEVEFKRTIEWYLEQQRQEAFLPAVGGGVER